MASSAIDQRVDFNSDAWSSDAQAVKIGIEIVPKIIEENGDAMAPDILCDKIEGKGVSRRTAYRRIAQRSGIIRLLDCGFDLRKAWINPTLTCG